MDGWTSIHRSGGKTLRETSEISALESASCGRMCHLIAVKLWGMREHIEHPCILQSDIRSITTLT